MFLITTPHATCNPQHPEIEHTCDYSAHLVAIMISQRLEQLGGNNFYIKGDINRRHKDLNRKESRGSIFRDTVNSIIRTFKNIVLIDVHSFPNYYIASAGDSNLFEPGEIPPDLVLLKSSNDLYNRQSLCSSLYKNLNKFSVKIREKVEVIDLVQSVQCPSILLEFNESMKDLPALVDAICEVLINM